MANTLVERAQVAAEAIKGEAERDARRARRAARREAVDALEQLSVLERLGAELHESVRAQRESLRTVSAAPEPAASAQASAAPPVATAPVEAAPRPVPVAEGTVEKVAPPEVPDPPRVSGRAADRRRRSGRASLRNRAVAELFQPTEPVPVRS